MNLNTHDDSVQVHQVDDHCTDYVIGDRVLLTTCSDPECYGLETLYTGWICPEGLTREDQLNWIASWMFSGNAPQLQTDDFDTADRFVRTVLSV